MPHLLRNTGLTIVLLLLFALSLGGQALTGERVYNADQRDHGEPTVTFGSYLLTGHFVEAVFENWESEFFQMGLYILLNAYLFQKGSSESKDPDKHESVDDDPQLAQGRSDAPWAVRRGGVVLKLYEHSLAIALLSLFVISFMLHVAGV